MVLAGRMPFLFTTTGAKALNQAQDSDHKQWPDLILSFPHTPPASSEKGHSPFIIPL